MCVFRELNAIGTWTNYAKQMVDQFLNAGRESWEYSKFRYLGRESKKFRISKYFAISGIRNYSVGKIKRKRKKKVICVNELY